MKSLLSFQNICFAISVIGMIISWYCAFSANREFKKFMKLREQMKG